MKIFKMPFNPYEKLSERIALALGLLFIPITSYFCFIAGGMFSDFLNFSSAANISFFKIFLVNASIGSLASLIFLILAKLFSKSKVRAIDVLAYILFSQIPLVFVPLLFLPEASNAFLNPPMPISQEWLSENSTPLAIALLSSTIIPLAWCFILMFNALKVSANLKGVRLWTVYLAGILLTVLAMRLVVFPYIVLKGEFLKPDKHSGVQLNIGASVLGVYEGVLNFPGKNLRFRLYIDNNGKEIKAHATSPDQGGGEIPIQNLNVSPLGISFSIASISVNFDGDFMEANGETILGIFTQHGYSVRLELKKIEDIYYTSSVWLSCSFSKENADLAIKEIWTEEFVNALEKCFNAETLNLLKTWNFGKEFKDIIADSHPVKQIIEQDGFTKIKISFTSKFAGTTQTVATEIARKIAKEAASKSFEFASDKSCEIKILQDEIFTERKFVKK